MVNVNIKRKSPWGSFYDANPENYPHWRIWSEDELLAYGDLVKLHNSADQTKDAEPILVKYRGLPIEVEPEQLDTRIKIGLWMRDKDAFYDLAIPPEALTKRQWRDVVVGSLEEISLKAVRTLPLENRRQAQEQLLTLREEGMLRVPLGSSIAGIPGHDLKRISKLPEWKNSISFNQNESTGLATVRVRPVLSYDAGSTSQSRVLGFMPKDKETLYSGVTVPPFASRGWLPYIGGVKWEEIIPPGIAAEDRRFTISLLNGSLVRPHPISHRFYNPHSEIAYPHSSAYKRVVGFPRFLLFTQEEVGEIVNPSGGYSPTLASDWLKDNDPWDVIHEIDGEEVMWWVDRSRLEACVLYGPETSVRSTTPSSGIVEGWLNSSEDWVEEVIECVTTSSRIERE
ncbi:hypothetical protein [Corynebacterium casei]|uniref:hypothetical protein n=1 Tax=Corynebacterium casei TaxID=160386 RepID=UPI003FD558DF